MNNCNDVYNGSFENKNPKKKKHCQISIVLNTNTVENTCEKDIEQNIHDFSKILSTKNKPINASENILMKNNYCIHNEIDEMKKINKKKKYIKSLNLIEKNTNNYAGIKMFKKTSEKFNEQNIGSNSRNNVSQKRKSEINALPDNNCSMDNENIQNKKPKKKNNYAKELNSYHDTENKTCEQNINDIGSCEILNQIIKSELNTLVNISLENNCSIDIENVKTMKLKKKKKHNKSLNLIDLNTNNDTEIKSFEKTCEEFNYQNQSQKTNPLSGISLENNCSIDIENVETKKFKKKKKHNKSLNLIDLSTNNDTEVKSFEKSCAEFNYQNKNDSSFTENISQKTNPTSDISLENNCSIDIENVKTMKLKKKKKHNKSLNLIDLNTNNDTEIKSFEKTCEEFNYQNQSQKTNPLSGISLENNCSIDIENVETKKFKKKKKHNKSLNLIDLSTNNDTEVKSFEKSCAEFNYQNKNDSSFTENISQKTNPTSDISLENNCSIDIENVKTMKLKKKKKHNKSLNLIDLNTNNDTEIKSFEKTCEEFNYQNQSQKTNPLSGISLENNCSIDIENVETKKFKKKKKHNKSLNLIDLSTNNDTEVKLFEKNCAEFNDQNKNDSSFTENISQKTNPTSDISLENNCSIDIENVKTMKLKKKKKHNKSLNLIDLNTNNDTEIKSFEKTCEEFNYQNQSQKTNPLSDISLENNCSIDIENVETKKFKKKKKHNKSLNLIDLSTNNDTEVKSFEKSCAEFNYQNKNDSIFTENISQKTNPTSDISLENNCSIDIENVKTMKLKKKKKHNKSLNLIDLSTNNDTKIKSFEKTCEEVNKQSNNDSYSCKNISQKRKYEINTLADIENIPTKKLKKKKNHNTENITFEEVSEPNIDDFESTENLNQTIKSEINTSLDISLLNNSSIDIENVEIKKIKKKKKHNKSLNLMEFSTSNNKEIDTIKRLSLRSDERILDSDTNISMSNRKKSKIHNVSTSDIKGIDNNYSVTKNLNMSMTSEKYNNITDQKLSQNYCKLRTLLNSMESNHFEDSINSSTKIDSKFNLMKYLKNKDPSIRNHPKYKQIIEILSKKIKKAVNKNHQITDSDVVLLKTIGNIILEKIVEKINSAQDINDLEITLPLECKENKIHFIETTLSRPPSKEKMNIIKKLNPQVKLRVFNSEEDNMIREYWSKFQKEYNISNILPFLSNGLEMSLDKTGRFQFIRYISAGLPNRLLSSVYNRFNILFNEHQDKTLFSEEEDQLIMKVEKCDAISNKFSVLSLILNRSRLQLYRRHEVLKNEHAKCKKFFWDDQKRQELFTNILLETNTDNWEDLKNLTLKKNTLIKIAKNLGDDVTYVKVRNQWNYLYTMLFCEKPIKMLTLRLNILELLEQQNPKYFSDVDWKEITNQLYPGANSKLICSFFHSWYKIVPSKIKKSVKDTLFYLRKHKEEKLRKEIRERGEREFPRLTVQDYDLLVNNE